MNLQIVIPFINFYLVIFKINLQFKKKVYFYAAMRSSYLILLKTTALSDCTTTAERV